MALATGTNSGFVLVAPVDDPAESGNAIGGNAKVMKAVAPAMPGTITEIGWYCSGATAESNFEVGLYDSDGAIVPGEAGTLLQVSRTNAKGTTGGWKVVSGLSWPFTASHTYWLGVQVDGTASIDRNTSGGPGADLVSGVTELPDPFGGGGLSTGAEITAIYALYTSDTTTGMEGQSFPPYVL